MQGRHFHRSRGVTLIELMVVVVLAGIVLALVAPSFKRMIEVQRVRSVNSQLLTDLQFARSEAASRATHVKVSFGLDATQYCYTIGTMNATNDVTAKLTCNCLLPAPCAVVGFTEIKTVRFPIGDGVRVRHLIGTGQGAQFAFEPLAGALFKIQIDAGTPAPDEYVIRTGMGPTADLSRELRTIVGISGRPTVCAPAGSKIQEATCP